MQSSRQQGDYVVEQLTNPPTNHGTTGPNETNTARTRNEKRSRNVCLQYMNEAGALHPLIPTKSNWYFLYISNPSLTKSFHVKFRRRFRLPYDKFCELLQEASENNWFRQVDFQRRHR